MSSVAFFTEAELKTISVAEMDQRIRVIRENYLLSPKQIDKLKSQRRKVGNRIYAMESRQNKRDELEYLERQNRLLKRRVASLEEENTQLRQSQHLNMSGMSLFSSVL